MQVHHDIHELPSFRNAVVTIGTFDGVHSGHRKIIEQLKAEAKSIDGESIIITFHPHPRKIVNPSERLQLINTQEEKIKLLSESGIDHLVIVPFTASFADMDAEAYINQFLINTFHPHTIIIGYDHHFGRNRKGNYQLLETYAEMYGYKLKEISKHTLDEVTVSSTKIRNALLQGRPDEANKLLDYQFFFDGIVIHGDKLGRKIGYPTANLKYTDRDKIEVAEGVYAAYAEVEGTRYKGMLSIGNRPTLPNSDRRVEINIFDFDKEIYDEIIRVYIIQFLREQVRYDTLDELVEQLHIDKKNALAIL